jgi:hypothetical protein
VLIIRGIACHQVRYIIIRSSADGCAAFTSHEGVVTGDWLVVVSVEGEELVETLIRFG